MPDKGWGRLAVQFLKFNAVGLVNTVIDFALFSLLLFLGMASVWAQVVSYTAGTANSFVMNKKITFTEKSGSPKNGIVNTLQFVRFGALNVAVLALTLLLLHLFIFVGGIPPLTAKLMVTGFTVIVNFYGNRKWVFTKQAYLQEE
ncbi:GtrA family protein [Paenibacillus fonticola]|uniref:GtrA family protein n=1 Tax=Paenibacillus fonticola TaxID=379896 RepID=UPI000379F0B7|nr:GtrA family protein [Paenibacillus fonticola]